MEFGGQEDTETEAKNDRHPLTTTMASYPGQNLTLPQLLCAAKKKLRDAILDRRYALVLIVHSVSNCYSKLNPIQNCDDPDLAEGKVTNRRWWGVTCAPEWLTRRITFRLTLWSRTRWRFSVGFDP